MKITEIGGQMRQIAEQIQSDHPEEAAALSELADELRRRAPAPRAPATARRCHLSLRKRSENSQKRILACRSKRLRSLT